MVNPDVRLLIVGAGAIGCLFAARLKRAGFQITLLEKVQETVDRINADGIAVEGVSGQYSVIVPAYSGRAPHEPDLVILCVKSYDTREASETIRPWLQPDAPILTLQNGVGNIEILQKVFGRENAQFVGDYSSRYHPNTNSLSVFDPVIRRCLNAMPNRMAEVQNIS